MSGVLTALAVALAGGLGAAARFVLDGLLSGGPPGRVPASTLVINVLGSFGLGLVAGVGPALAPAAASVVGIGFLGGFTTFSTAMVELVRLVDAGRQAAAVLLAAAMLGLAVAAALVGLWAGAALA